MIKQEPKCEEDFEDFFCEDGIKVCLLYIKILLYHYVDVIISTCFVYHIKFIQIFLK